MISSPKAKAWVALIVTAVVAVGAQLGNLNLISGDAQHTCTVVIGIITAIATTLGVYSVPNQEA